MLTGEIGRDGQVRSELVPFVDLSSMRFRLLFSNVHPLHHTCFLRAELKGGLLLHVAGNTKSHLFRFHGPLSQFMHYENPYRFSSRAELIGQMHLRNWLTHFSSLWTVLACTLMCRELFEHWCHWSVVTLIVHIDTNVRSSLSLYISIDTSMSVASLALRRPLQHRAVVALEIHIALRIASFPSSPTWTTHSSANCRREAFAKVDCT